MWKFLEKIRYKLSFNLFLSSINGFYRYFLQTKRSRFGYISETAVVRFPIRVKFPENCYLYDRCHIMGNALISCAGAKFIMKKNSCAAEGLTVVTNTHPFYLGEWYVDKGLVTDYIVAKDIIVEEDVWIASNVTLLMGTHIHRGVTVGAGTVIRSEIPPYAIVLGNPAKIVGFRFTPEEIIEHEKVLYPEEERLPLEFLEKNYNKYFLKRLKEIKEIKKI